MAQKVVIFQDLLEQFPALSGAISSRGYEVLKVVGGREALETTRQIIPAAVLLDVAMPQMSGIEACRQIKEASLSPMPKVVLVSAISSSTIMERAQGAGCDCYSVQEGAEEKILEFLPPAESARAGAEEFPPSKAERPAPAPQNEEALRVAPRIEASVKLSYWIGDSEYHGELINISTSGVLIATHEAVAEGTPVAVRLPSKKQGDLDFHGVVVRTIPMKTPRRGLSYAVGARIEKIEEEDRAKIEELVTLRQAAKETGLKFDPEFVQRLMNASPEILQSVVRGEESNPSLKQLFGEPTQTEQEAFSSEGEVHECVRRSVLTRVRCEVFHAFLPTVISQKSVLAPLFIPFLAPLIERADQIEEELATLARQASDEGSMESRQALIASANQLAQSKEQLIFSVEAEVSPDGLGPQAENISALHERAAYLRSLRSSGDMNLKYDRKKPPPAPEKEEKAAPKRKGFLSRRPVQIAVLVLFLIVAGGWIRTWLGSRVTQSELEIPLPISRGVETEEGLDLYVKESDWKNLSEENVEETFNQVETYIAKKKRRQVKIMDEDSKKTLAAVLGGRVGRKMTYQRRIFSR